MNFDSEYIFINQTWVKKHKQYRLKYYDYTKPGKYFITICTNNKKEIFGSIANSRIKLSEIGIITEKIWNDIPQKFKNIKLDEWIIMPNHIHGIIVTTCRNLINQIPTTIFNQIPTSIFGQIPAIPNNPMTTRHTTVGGIIRWFKGKSTYEIHKKMNMKGKIWQSRFYDHIVENDIALENIRKYIRLNIVNWAKDRNNFTI